MALVVVITVWRLVGCGPTDVGGTLDVVFLGCDVVVRGPICRRASERPLTLWIDAPRLPALAVHVDGKLIEAQRREIAGGIQLRTGPLPQSGTLVIDTQDRPPRSWSLLLEPARSTPEVREAWARRAEGRYQDAWEAVVRALDGPLPQDLRAQATGMLGRLEINLGRLEAGFARLHESINAADAIGHVSGAFRDAVAAAYSLTFRAHRLDEAAAMLDWAAQWIDEYPRARAILPYHRAILHSELGDYRRALRELEEAALWSKRLGDDAKIWDVADARAWILLQLGRPTGALAELKSVGVEGLLPSCDRISTVLGRKGSAYVSLGKPAKADALLQASLLQRVTSCRDPFRLVRSATDLLLNALRLGAIDEAEAWLEIAHYYHTGPQGTPSASLHLLGAEAQIHLKRGRTDLAGAAYEALNEKALEASLPRHCARSQVGLARVAMARGDSDAALRYFEQAQSIWNVMGLRVPLGAGRGAMVVEGETATRAHVSLLLALERPSEALQVVRTVRVRMLTDLQWAAWAASEAASEKGFWRQALSEYRRARRDLNDETARIWRAPPGEVEPMRRRLSRKLAALRARLDEVLSALARRAPGGIVPPTPPPHELLLAYHPIEKGWVAFAALDGKVEFNRLGAVDPEAPSGVLSDQLLAPFRKMIESAIESAGRIRVLPYAQVRPIDIHALPWDDGLLIEHVPVVYGVGLHAVEASWDSSPAPAEEPSDRVLVVTDPIGDLPGARTAGEIVRAAVTGIGRPVDLLSQPPRVGLPPREGVPPATMTNVLAFLPRSYLLHYAGHGEAGGADGWQSSLLLADGARLYVGDILALPSVPRWIVLSGCETGRTGPESPGETLGVAQAFLLRGTEAVLGTTRVIADNDRFARALYRDIGDLETVDWARRLQAAAVDLADADPPVDWAAWRVFVP